MSSPVVASVIAGLLGLIMGIFIGVYSAMEEVTDLRTRLNQEKALSEAVIKQLKRRLEDKKEHDRSELYGDGDISDGEQSSFDELRE